MTILSEQQRIGRGSRVKEPPTIQHNLFEEPKFGIPDDQDVTGSLYFNGYTSAATLMHDCHSINHTNQTISANPDYVSNNQVLYQRIDDLEKKLMEYIERDAKNAHTGFGAGEYFGTMSNYQFATINVVKNPTCPEARIDKSYIDTQTMENMKNG